MLNFIKEVIKTSDLYNCSTDDTVGHTHTQHVIVCRQINIKWNDQTIYTNTYILTSHKQQLPKVLYVGYQVVKVNISTPLRCTNCQKFGHHVSKCSKTSSACVIHSQSHTIFNNNALPVTQNVQIVRNTTHPNPKQKKNRKSSKWNVRNRVQLKLSHQERWAIALAVHFSIEVQRHIGNRLLALLSAHFGNLHTVDPVVMLRFISEHVSAWVRNRKLKPTIWATRNCKEKNFNSQCRVWPLGTWTSKQACRYKTKSPRSSKNNQLINITEIYTELKQVQSLH